MTSVCCVYCKSSKGELINPCKCDRLCHADCFNRVDIDHPYRVYKCDTCDSNYNLKRNSLPWWVMSAHYYCRVTGDVCGLLALLGLFVWTMRYVVTFVDYGLTGCYSACPVLNNTTDCTPCRPIKQLTMPHFTDSTAYTWAGLVLAFAVIGVIGLGVSEVERNGGGGRHSRGGGGGGCDIYCFNGCGGGSKDDCATVAIAICIVITCILACIGLILSIFYAPLVFKRICERRAHLRYLEAICVEYPVGDYYVELEEHDPEKVPLAEIITRL